MRQFPARRRAGFTLIELLVVIAIIAVLVGLLVPAVQQVRESANRTQCLNNLKQLGIALHAYHDANKAFPPSRTTVTPQHSWSAHILPYIEQKNVGDMYNFKLDWNNPQNYPAIQIQIPIFNCPSNPLGERYDTTIASQPAGSDYSPINAIKDFVGINCFGYPGIKSPDDPRLIGALVRDKLTRLTDIRDGTSQTIMIAEDAARPGTYMSNGQIMPPGPNNPGAKEGGWADPGQPFSIDGSNSDGTVPGPCALNCSNNSELYSFHPAGANVIMSDGSGRPLNASIDLCTLAAITTRAAGELVASDFTD